MSDCEVHQRWKLPPPWGPAVQERAAVFVIHLQQKRLARGLTASQWENPAQASGLAFSWCPGLTSHHWVFLDVCLGLRFVPTFPAPPSQEASQSKQGNVNRLAGWLWAGARKPRQWKALPGHLCGKSCCSLELAQRLGINQLGEGPCAAFHRARKRTRLHLQRLQRLGAGGAFKGRWVSHNRR